MDCDQCAYFLDALQAPWDFLFDQNGFRLVHCAAQRKGDYCLAVFESPKCRIKIELEIGIPTAYLGTLDSPLQWGSEVNGVKVWYATHGILAFIQKLPPPSGPLFPKAEKPLTLAEMLTREAAPLRQHLAEAEAAFAPDRSAAWWEAYEAYQAERTRQIRAKLGL